ncbi:hypothetical protein [Epilithonimonas arachidiradicis]|nr:hypothetical protein [Epilithonimonas arachidiradicis]GGG43177.1 hypothetical protein GCM10007332_00860 [Epilithonimonas arachidiradicis]
MKKIITTVAALAFGTVFITAQTTKKTETKSTTKNVELRSKKYVKQNNAPKMVDTANIEHRQKKADENITKPDAPHGDGLTDEATKPSQIHPRPGQTE